MANPFSKRHLWVFLGLLAAATVLNYFALDAGVDQGAEHTQQVIVTTLATITGPMTGGIAREGQGCCVGFSLQVLLIISGPALLIGLLMQLIPLPFKKGAGAVRMFFWTAGWFIWFLGGFISYCHALV